MGGAKGYAFSNDNGAWSHSVLVVQGADGSIYDLEYAFEKEAEVEIKDIISSFRLMMNIGTNKLTSPSFQFDSDTSIEYYAPYIEVKKMLLEKGYSFFPLENLSAGEFPEIGDCGSGMDAICHVGFEKGGIRKHLNVAMSSQRAFADLVKKYPNPYWIVIGNE